MQSTKRLEVYLEIVKNFKDWYYLFILFTEVAYASMWNIDFEPPYQILEKLPKFWHLSHFLVDVGSYVYKLDDLSQEENYMKGNW